jgi:hypothetical protein
VGKVREGRREERGDQRWEERKRREVVGRGGRRRWQREVEGGEMGGEVRWEREFLYIMQNCVLISRVK